MFDRKSVQTCAKAGREHKNVEIPDMHAWLVCKGYEGCECISQGSSMQLDRSISGSRLSESVSGE